MKDRIKIRKEEMKEKEWGRIGWMKKLEKGYGRKFKEWMESQEFSDFL